MIYHRGAGGPGNPEGDWLSPEEKEMRLRWSESGSGQDFILKATSPIVARRYRSCDRRDFVVMDQ